MDVLFDGIFQVVCTIMAVPFFLAIVMAAFGIMSGQKPERAIGGAVTAQFRLVVGLLKALLRAALSGGTRAASANQYGEPYNRETNRQNNGGRDNPPNS